MNYNPIPPQTGQSGKFLSTDGSSVNWAAVAATTPGGSSGQVQFNSAGVFGGAAALTYAASGTHLLATAQSTGVVPFAVQAASGQTGALTEWRSAAGTPIKITALGGLQFTNYFGGDQGYIGPSSGNISQWVNTVYQDRVIYGSGVNGTVLACSTNNSGYFYAGVALPNANSSVITEFMFAVDYNGRASFGGLQPQSSTGRLAVLSKAINERVLTLRGLASQSSPILDCQNSGESTLFAIGATGQVCSNQTAAATTLGSVARRLPIYDANGTLLGQIPIYDAIT